MKRRAIIVTVILLLAAATVYAQHAPRSQRGSCPGPGMNMDFGRQGMNGDFIRPGMLLKMADEIGLDANQKAQIDKLAQDNGLERIEQKAELEKAQLQLRHMQANDAPEAQVLKAMDDIGRIKTEMRKSAYTFRRNIKSILSEDQLNKIKELRKDRRGKGDFRSGDRQGGSRGRGQGFAPNPDPDYGFHEGRGQ